MPINNKAQASVEILIIIAIFLAGLAIITFVLLNLQNSFSGSIEAKKARTTIDTISDAAEKVHQQGLGAKTKVFVTIPNNVNFITISENILLVNLDAGGDARDTYGVLDFNISGDIPTERGNVFLYLEAKEDHVQITQNKT